MDIWDALRAHARDLAQWKGNACICRRPDGLYEVVVTPSVDHVVIETWGTRPRGLIVDMVA